MKKSALPILLTIIIIALFYFLKPDKAVGPVGESDSVEDQKDTMNNESLSSPGLLPEEEIMSKKATINTDKGDIVIELFADKSPLTVSNFVYLANNSFYNGLTFHRVVPNFVIQGGDPKGDGSGNPGYSFDDEEVKGEYVEGSVAMANSGPNTNGSQFFICLEDQPDLPKSYNLFGIVTSGMDVVKSIEINDKINFIKIESNL